MAERAWAGGKTGESSLTSESFSRSRSLFEPRAFAVQAKSVGAGSGDSRQQGSDLLAAYIHRRRIADLGHASRVQPKLIRWDNPVLDASKLPTPAEGADEVKAAAETIDEGTEEGRKDVMAWVGDYHGGSKTSDQVKTYFTGKGTDGHVSNFVNKLIDWGKSASGTALRLLKATAGCIIEDYAGTKADGIGAKSQVATGGARPDFEFETGKTWTVKAPKTAAANGYIDATSWSEAKKGHISEKITRIGEKDALDHPHLYDTYYEDLDIADTKPTVSILEEASDAYLERTKEMARRIERARNRRGSLRSAKKQRAFGPY